MQPKKKFPFFPVKCQRKGLHLDGTAREKAEIFAVTVKNQSEVHINGIWGWKRWKETIFIK